MYESVQCVRYAAYPEMEVIDQTAASSPDTRAQAVLRQRGIFEKFREQGECDGVIICHARVNEEGEEEGLTWIFIFSIEPQPEADQEEERIDQRGRCGVVDHAKHPFSLCIKH